MIVQKASHVILKHVALKNGMEMVRAIVEGPGLRDLFVNPVPVLMVYTVPLFVEVMGLVQLHTMTIPSFQD